MTRALAIIGALSIAAQAANIGYGAYHGAKGADPVQCSGVAYAYAYGFWSRP
jgi:hypothetical protein